MKKLLNDVSVSSVLIAIVGLVLLLMPSLSSTVIVYGIGVALVVYGIGRVFRYMKRDAPAAMMDFDLTIGLISAIVGLLMILYCRRVIEILPFLFGLFLLFGGARSIQTAFDVRRFHGTHWNLHLFIGIIFAVLGILAIRDPFSTAQLLTRFVGAGLLMLGVYRFLTNRKINNLRAQYMSEDDIIDQDSVK